MATKFRIKRRLLGGSGPGSPSGLLNAELAFNENDRLLYIGIGDDGTGVATNAIAINGAAATLPSYTSNSLKVLRVNSGATGVEWSTPGTTGVNSVAVQMPDYYSVSGTPITATSGNNTGVGTINVSLLNQSKNLILASPTSTTGTPSFRSLVASDIPTSSIPLNSFANPTANLDFGGTFTLGNIPNPTTPLQVANKQYVDGLSQGLAIKNPVAAATTTNITLYNVQTVDGVVLSVGQRVLVKNQTNPVENGIYIVTSTGWVRASDADSVGELQAGSYVFVENGASNANSSFVLITSGTVTPGVTGQTWVVFATAGLIAAGNGLIKNGSILDIVGANGIVANADTVELTGQALAFHNLSSTGLVVRTGSATVSAITIVGTTDQITVTNGTGLSGNPTIALAATYKGQASIDTVGTITSGEWKSTTAPIGVSYGGTGNTTFTSGGVLFGNGTSALSSTSRAVLDGSVLTQNATGSPFFTNVLDGGIF